MCLSTILVPQTLSLSLLHTLSSLLLAPRLDLDNLASTIVCLTNNIQKLT